VAFWISRSGRQPAVKVGGCESIGIDYLSKCFVHSWFAVSHSFSADERTWLDVRIYGVAQFDCSNGGRRGWAEHAPCTDSTARNTLTSKALLDPLIPEHDGQETCKVGLAGAIYPQAGQDNQVEFLPTRFFFIVQSCTMGQLHPQGYGMYNKAVTRSGSDWAAYI
jgi:hypothetical protein